MDNFFNFDDTTYNTADLSVQSDYTIANVYLANRCVTLDTLNLAVTDGTAIDSHTMGNRMPYPQSQTAHPHTPVPGNDRIPRAYETHPLGTGFDTCQWQHRPAPRPYLADQMPASAVGFLGCTGELIDGQAAPIYPSSMQDTDVLETQRRMPDSPESFLEPLNMGFDPSSSSLAGALGKEAGSPRKHTSRAARYAPYPRVGVPAVEKNEAGPSGQSRTDSRERAPIVLPTLPIFGQTTEAAAGEQNTIIEEVQDTPPGRKRHSRKSRILFRAAMEDLKHELVENWGCESNHRSLITEVWALRAAFLEIALAGPPPIHAEQILTNHKVERRPPPAKERSERAKREKARRDKAHVLLEELSRYVPWPTHAKHGPHQHQVVLNALEILQGLTTRRLLRDA